MTEKIKGTGRLRSRYLGTLPSRDSEGVGALSGRSGGTGYLAVVLLLPLLALWRQDNALFTGYGYIDPWIYFGYFRNLVEFKRSLFIGNPHGAHLSWILPGAALHHYFAPVTATCLLHLGVQTLATVSLFLTLKWLAGARRAFVAAMVFSVNPWLWAATGWDYVDGIGIAYSLLTIALLTSAARNPARQWALIPAGMALAALFNTGAGWLTLAPLFPLYYVGLMWTWHRTPLLRSGVVLGAWFGAGCFFMAAIFSAVNHSLDGLPLRSLLFQPRAAIATIAAVIVLAGLFVANRKFKPVDSRRALYPLLLVCALAWIGLFLISSGRSSSAPWQRGLWQNGVLSPWLWFPLIAAVTAFVVLYSERRTPAAMLSLQFLLALSWMIAAQLRGHAELGEFSAASKLLPFAFLVIGARFWPEADEVRLLDFLIFCGATAAILAYAWLPEGMTFAAGLPYAPWLGAAALLVALFWRSFPEYLICSVGGFFVLTAVGTGARYGGIDPHAFRSQLQLLSLARERVELVRQAKPIRFWYDAKDAAMPAAVALSSTYVGEESLLSHTFDAPPCNKPLTPSTVVATIASDALHGPDAVASALSVCWNGTGLHATPLEIDNFRRGPSGYQISFLRIDRTPPAP
jgi:hypothetical protein